MITLKIKKLTKDAIMPTKAHETDAGLDLYAIKKKNLASGAVVLIETGIAIDIPDGYYGQIFERSSFAKDNTMVVKAGVIDAGYHGEVKVVMQNCGNFPTVVSAKAKVAQLVILPLPKYILEEVQDFEESERGIDGFGSSDK